MYFMKKTILAIFTASLIAAGCSIAPVQQSPTLTTSTPPTAASPSPTSPSSTTPAPTNGLYLPISNGADRVTKKYFGTYVTPANSPVQPEKFKGYHTGIDFETTPEEQNVEVPILAACDGKLLLKK